MLKTNWIFNPLETMKTQFYKPDAIKSYNIMYNNIRSYKKHNPHTSQCHQIPLIPKTLQRKVPPPASSCNLTPLLRVHRLL